MCQCFPFDLMYFGKDESTNSNRMEGWQLIISCCDGHHLLYVPCRCMPSQIASTMKKFVAITARLEMLPILWR